MEHAIAPDRSGAVIADGTLIGAPADITGAAATAVSLPSVPPSVDFSTCVALRERK
jgi:hypothetical protein